MSKAKQELNVYKKKYKQKELDYEFFELLFSNEEVSDEFLDEFGEELYYHLEHPEYEEFNDYGDYVSVWGIYFKHTKASIDKIDKYAAHSEFSNIASNKSLTEEMVVHILKENVGALDGEWYMEFPQEAFTDEFIKQNLHYIDINLLLHNRYFLSADLLDFLLVKEYVDHLDLSLRSAEGIDLDFIKKHEGKLSITLLSENNDLSEEVVWYLIENHPGDIDWNHILALVKMDKKDYVKYEKFIGNYTDYTGVVNYFAMESDLLEYLLDKAIEEEPFEIEWYEVSTTQTFTYELFAKYYDHLKIHKVMENPSVPQEERELMENHHLLKTMFE